MAAEFPPNLDDGELWLPSEIIPDVGICRRHHHHHHHQSPAVLRPGYSSDDRYVSDLAQQLAAFGLLGRSFALPTVKPRPNLSPHSEGLTPIRSASRSGLAELDLAAGLGYDGYRSPLPSPAAVPARARAGTGAYILGAPRPLQQYNPGKPVQSQFDASALARARVLQRQQNRFVPPARVGGMGRESGGTGVFLPRVGFDNNAIKKTSTKGGEQQRQHARTAADRRQGVVPLQSPTSEMGLPHDWTY